MELRAGGKSNIKRSQVGETQATPTPVELSPGRETIFERSQAGKKRKGWTTPENIGLLKLYQDNPDRKKVSHARISELHNARFWPNDGEVRTKTAISQQYLKLVKHDDNMTPEKPAELKAPPSSEQ